MNKIQKSVQEGEGMLFTAYKRLFPILLLVLLVIGFLAASESFIHPLR